MLNTAPRNERTAIARLEAGATLPKCIIPTFFLQHIPIPFFVPSEITTNDPLRPHQSANQVSDNDRRRPNDDTL